MQELQRDLAWLGGDIQPQEIAVGSFGETTRAGVQMLQKQNRLEPDGVVDIKTVEAIMATPASQLRPCCMTSCSEAARVLIRLIPHSPKTRLH